MPDNLIGNKLSREMALLKTETLAEQGEGKLLSRILRRIHLEIGRLRNIAATRTLSTEQRVCKLVDAQIRELHSIHRQRNDAPFYRGELKGSYELDLKADVVICKKIQETIPKIDQLLFLLRAKASPAGENRIAELRQNLRALSDLNEDVLKEYYRLSPPTAPQDKIPSSKDGGKRKGKPQAISSRLPRKAEMQKARREAKRVKS